MLTVSAFALVAMMAACGGSAKSDGAAMGKKACECMKLQKDGKTEDALKCLEEGEKMEKEYTAKYEKDTVASKEFEEAAKAEFDKCK